jgi:5-methylcytosine-specific restriction endonuclease McrA
VNRPERLAQLVARDGTACRWCALPLPEDMAGVHIDHLIPISAGGPDALWNLQLLHGLCNRLKGSRLTPAAYVLLVQYRLTLALLADLPLACADE